MDMKENKQEVKNFLIKVTEDAEIRDLVRQGLKDNEGYCPCKIKHIPDNKCMCKNFRNKIEAGLIGEYCECGLYWIAIKDDVDFAKQFEFGQIKELAEKTFTNSEK